MNIQKVEIFCGKIHPNVLVVLVRKNSSEIILCLDFKILNCASDKDNYLVPPMEQILQMVSGSELLSLLDGFLVYNQVLVVE